jgi:hypothetical protein
MAVSQPNVVNDVGTLLKVPNKVLDELNEKSCLCISSIIREAKLAGESSVQMSIGIGSLSVNLIDMQCKFIPNKMLKTAIKTGLSSEIDPVELMLEKAFADKLLAICDEVI